MHSRNRISILLCDKYASVHGPSAYMANCIDAPPPGELPLSALVETEASETEL